MKAIALTLATGLLACAAAIAANAPPPQVQALSIPVSRPDSGAAVEPEPPPKRFETRHSVQIGDARVDYRAIAGETYLYNRAGDPIGSIFSFSYLKEGASDPRRPVLFVFNGGPGSSSVWLHLGVVGPRRLVLDHEVNPSNVPPFGVADNPSSLLDVTDLVFIDPVGTGYSRVIGRGTTADFWGVDQDADSVAQFIELWLDEHGRWNSPKFVMGESYGSTRAAVLSRALMAGPTYLGMMRGVTLNGVILLGTTLEMPFAKTAGDTSAREALSLPALADTAWYHEVIDRKGRSLPAFHDEVLQFARTEYAPALSREKAGTLPATERAALVAKLAAYTGLAPAEFKQSLALQPQAFAGKVLAGRGLDVGAYDGRYTLPSAGKGIDPVADDPAMGRYVPGFIAAFHDMITRELQVRMDRPYGAIVWKDLLPAWDWKRSGVAAPDDFAADLGIAMRRNPDLHLLVASGYFDLVTTSAAAEAQVARAHLPADRVTLKRYESGHMLYLGDTADDFANDVRELIRKASR